MMLRGIADTPDEMLPHDHARLVRLCAHLTGDA